MIQYSAVSAGEYYFHIHDHLGNTRVVVDVNKNVVERYDYYPFGSVSRSTVSSSIETIQKFTGKELDDEHGLDLYYFGARYHDPVVGRFVSVDPLAEKRPGLTPYNYVSNNPIIRIDPDGRIDSICKFGIKHYLPLNNKEKVQYAAEEATVEIAENTEKYADMTSDLATDAAIGLAAIGLEPVAAVSLATAKIADGIAFGASLTKAMITKDEADVKNVIINAGEIAVGSMAEKSIKVAKRVGTSLNQRRLESMSEKFIDIVGVSFKDDEDDRDSDNNN